MLGKLAGDGRVAAAARVAAPAQLLAFVASAAAIALALRKVLHDCALRLRGGGGIRLRSRRGVGHRGEDGEDGENGLHFGV